jgi:hypothetical protein
MSRSRKKMERKKEGERGRRGLLILLRNLFVCMKACTNRQPHSTSKTFSLAEFQMRISKKIWRLTPSNSVKSYVSEMSPFAPLDRIVYSI